MNMGIISGSCRKGKAGMLFPPRKVAELLSDLSGTRRRGQYLLSSIGNTTDKLYPDGKVSRLGISCQINDFGGESFSRDAVAERLETNALRYRVAAKRKPIRRLFIPQRFDGIQARSFPSRVEAEDDPDRSRDNDGGDNGQHRRLRGPMKENADQEGPAAPKKDAHGPAEKAQHDCFHEELAEDIPRPRAHGHAQADLPRALGDRNQHDVHDADPADDQRN